MEKYSRILHTAAIIGDVLIVVLAVLQLIGLFEQAVYLIMPLLCIEMILQGLLSWNRNKVVGICSFGVAAFVLYELLHVWLR